MRRLVAVLLLGLAILIVGSAAPVVAQAPSRAPAAPQPGVVAERIAGRAITLEEALAIALENQPQILARLYDYAAARFRVDQALSPLLPQVTGTVAVNRFETTGPPGIAISRNFSDTFLGQVALSQLLFDFGKNAASVDASRKLAQVALEDVELQRQLITLTVKEAYTNTLFAQRLIRVQRQALERAQLNLRSARGFFEVGTRPKSDVSRAEVDVANARVDLIRAANAERLARVALNTAMGLPAETPTEIVDNLVYATVTLDRAQLLPEALKQRPEYRQAKLRVENAESTVKRTFRDFFPDIVGSGAYGARTTDLHEDWLLGLSLNWSIFDGGNRLAKYREARANVDAAQARVKATELDISREVEQTQLIVAESDERIQAAQTAVASAQENFRLAQGRFDAGVGTILELTDAQLALTQAQNAEALALADFRIALARLDRALGRR